MEATMSAKNVFFLEVLEWLHPTATEVAHRLPESGSGEFKMGARSSSPAARLATPWGRGGTR
jgi:hypothetical protein